MTLHNAPARFAQGKTASLPLNKFNRLSSGPPAIGETFRVIPQFIDRREVFDEEDGGGSIVQLGLSRADRTRLHVDRIEVDCPDGSPIIERHQQFDVTVTGSRFEHWGNYPATIIEATAEIVPFEPSFYTKVDGLSAADCRSLEKRFGPDFVIKIAADNELMSATRHSHEKKALIIEACKQEKKDAESDTALGKKVMALLCACGHEGKGTRSSSTLQQERNSLSGSLGGTPFVQRGRPFRSSVRRKTR
jgi:hypothetical protein